MSDWLYKLRNGFLRGLTLFAIWMARVMPKSACYAMARGLANLFLRVQPKRMTVMEQNLDIAFGDEYSDEEKRRIARRSVRGLAITAMEFLRISHRGPESVEKAIVESEGIEELRQDYEQGEGIIALGMHYCNWEIAGAYLAREGFRLVAVGREQRDDFFTRLIFPMRERLGVENLRKGQVSSQMIRALHDGAILGLLTDQNGGKDGVFTEFMGHTASTSPGPAVFYRKYRCPVWLCFTRRIEPERFRFEARRVEIGELPEGDKEEQIKYITQTVNDAYAEVIREEPEQWLWLHKRWKSQPGGTYYPYED